MRRYTSSLLLAAFLAAAFLAWSAHPLKAQTAYTITDLGSFPDDDSSLPENINFFGQIVGSAPTDGNDHAFLWDSASGMIDLGTLGDIYPAMLSALTPLDRWLVAPKRLLETAAR